MSFFRCSITFFLLCTFYALNKCYICAAQLWKQVHMCSSVVVVVIFFFLNMFKWTHCIQPVQLPHQINQLTMFANDETKRRRMVQTPTMVLFVRDWTILLVTVWKAAGKS